MKVGVIGAGAVGSACILALAMRNCVQEIIILDKDRARAKAIAMDQQYGATLSGTTRLYAGDYADLKGASLIMITAGVNEKTGGATDRSDPKGRLKLLSTNANIYRNIVPQIIAVAPEAILLIVTDPPDPLAELTRKLAPNAHVISTGTFLDTIRFRTHLGRYYGVDPMSVNAQVLGEHGTSEVFIWSTVNIGGMPISDLPIPKNQNGTEFQQALEHEVRYANIAIIEGNNASQYGIGMICARITQIILGDEKLVFPIGFHQKKYGITLSLPCLIGKTGVLKTFLPQMNEAESQALQHSAEVLTDAWKTIC